MKVACINDTHSGVRSDVQIFVDFQKKFYQEVFFPYIDKHQITHLIHLGDVFDRRKYINFYTLYQWKQFFFDELAKRNIRVYMIVGNHDAYFRESNKVNACDLLLREYKNIEVVSSPTTVHLDNYKVVLMPWINEENWEDALDVIKTTPARALFGHLEIKDFEMYRNNFVFEGLDEELFDKFDVVASGHFHQKSSRKNIHYLGAPYPMTWADFECERGFNIFDTETKEFEHIPNPFTIFEKLYYDDVAFNIDEINEMDFSNCKDKFVKLVVKNKNNQYWFDIFLSRLEKASPFQIQIDEESINLNTQSDEKLFAETDDIQVILSRYIDQVDYGEKKKLNKFLNEIYIEAYNQV